MFPFKQISEAIFIYGPTSSQFSMNTKTIDPGDMPLQARAFIGRADVVLERSINLFAFKPGNYIS